MIEQNRPHWSSASSVALPTHFNLLVCLASAPPSLLAAMQIREVLPKAAWQHCYVHFLRNALNYVPHKVDYD
jgi:hypothetical protein